MKNLHMNMFFGSAMAVFLTLWSMGAQAQEQASVLLKELLSANTGTHAARPEQGTGLSADVAGGTCEAGGSALAPDPAFGSDGLALLGFDVPTPINVAGRFDDSAMAVAMQPDGKLLVGGWATVGPDHYGTDAALLRMLPNGQPDPGFGDNGRLLLRIRPNPGSARITDIAVQPDGRIVVFGNLCAGNNSCSNQNLFFARLMPDGSFDTSFDFNGSRILDPTGFDERSSALAIQPDGKLLGVGSSWQVFGEDTLVCALVLRLNPDGSSDNGFGTGGHSCLFPDSNSGQPAAAAADLALLADGRILVAGAAIRGDGLVDKIDMAVFRISTNGELDTSFGDQGWSFVAFDQGGYFTDEAYAMALDASGRILLTGHVDSVQSNVMGVARLLPNGILDGSFGTGGKVLLPFDDNGLGSRANGITLLPDGRILISGSSHRLSTEAIPTWVQSGAAAMLDSHGNPEPCFGESGRWTQALPDHHRGEFNGLVVGGGRVYLAGWADVPDPSSNTDRNTDFMITAFGGLPLPDAIFSDRFEALQ